MTVVEGANLLQSLGVVSFSFPLVYRKFKGVFKKDLKTLPKEWQKFTIDVPIEDRVSSSHNGLGILTGAISLLFGLDIDNVPQFEAYLKDISKTLPLTWTVKTGSNGRHYYFKWDSRLEKIKTSSKLIVHDGVSLDVDVRSNNGFLICPPSQAMAGSELKSYEWIHAPDSTDLAEMPDWLFEALTQKFSGKKSAVTNKSSSLSLTPTLTPKSKSVSNDLADFVLDTYGILPDKITEIKYDSNSDTFCIGLKEKACVFVKREHSSNHQYLVIKKDRTIVRKCHSKKNDCEAKEFRPTQVPEAIVNELIKEYKTESVEQDINLTKLACEEGTEQVKELFIGSEIQTMRPLENKTLSGSMVKIYGHNKCWHCKKGQIGVYLDQDGVHLSCDSCTNRIPGGNVKLPMDLERYMNLNQYLQINFNLVVNNTNITNNYNSTSKGAIQEGWDIGWNEFVEDRLVLADDHTLNELILASLAGTHMRVADLGYHYLGKSLAYCTVQNKWYAWGPHLWREVTSEEVHTLLRQSQLTPTLMKAKRTYEQSTVKLKDRKVTQIQKVITQLENNGYQNSIIEQIRIQCSKPKKDFYDKLDKNTKIWAFVNGVYDLCKYEFRPGTPEDYVTMSCGFDWDIEKMNDEAVIREVNDFFFKVFPMHDVGKCFLMVCGSALEGFTGNQVLYFCHGGGGNGKGVIGNLLLKVFGDYGGTLQASFLTGKTPDANAPTPALTSIIGKRLIITQEIEQGASLNVPLFKSLTGQDKMQYRPMYGECREFVPTSQTLFMCNHLPKFPAEDQAMKRRIETFPFISTFKDVEDGPLDTSRHEYPKDKSLTEKLESWKWVFMNFLIQGHQFFKTEGIKIPKDMRDLKLKYIAGNDIWAMIKEDLFEPTTGGGIESTAVKVAVKNWFKENSIPSPRAMDLISQIDVILLGKNLEKGSNERRYTVNKKTYTGYPNWKFKSHVESRIEDFQSGIEEL